MQAAVCYLCGKSITGESSGDHVPRKRFFAKSMRAKQSVILIKLPTHPACNFAYQADEDYFLNSLLPLYSDEKVVRDTLEDVARSFTRPEGLTLAKKILGEFEERPSGLILPPDMMVKRFEGEGVEDGSEGLRGQSEHIGRSMPQKRLFALA